MRADVIVLPDPLVDHDLGLFDCCNPFSVSHLFAERFIEGLVVSILPGRAGLDLHGLDPGPREPLLKRRGDKLRGIVGTDIVRFTALEQYWVKRL